MSHFLICKHLVQSVGPVPPTFYLEVRHNQTTPFWLHLILQPEGVQDSTTASGSSKTLPTLDANMIKQDESDDKNDGLIDTEPEWTTGSGKSCCEQLDKHIKAICDFCDGLEY